MPELIEFDSKQDKVFLLHDLIDDQKKLYVTKNFGETFSHVQDYVKAFYLDHRDGQTRLYVQRMLPGEERRTTILASRNFFERQVIKAFDCQTMKSANVRIRN